VRITSRQHSVVARLRALAARPEAGVALLDGDHLVADALECGVPLDVVLGDERCALLLARAAAAGADAYEASDAIVAAARPVRGATGGIVGIARWAPRDLTAMPATGMTIGLVDVQDPGNVGGAIRSAEALEASAVLALGDSANPAGWKALRGSMGSTFRVPVARASIDEAIAHATRRNLTIAATVASGGDSIEDADLTTPMLLLVGNEGAGLPDALLQHADRRLTIPMRPNVNSLNVSVTAALVLWARRQQLRALAAHR
jgi:TrmH family RNA methyltransferase